MKQIFKNLYAFDDKLISKKPIYVEDGIIVDEFEKDDETEIIDCDNLAVLPLQIFMYILEIRVLPIRKT